MLGTLRKGATGFFSKLLLLLLIASFGVWGIGDIFRGGGTENVVASIDDEPLTLNALENMIARIQEDFGDVSADIFNDIGFRTEVLNKLINDELIEREAADLGLQPSQQTLIGVIARNPAFQTADGNFDKNRFISVLYQNNLNEQAYLGKLSDQLISNFLINTISTGMPVSDQLVEALFTIREETREAELVLMTTKDAPAITAPAEEQLKDYYSMHTQRYMQPEYRSLSYVTMTPDSLFKALDLDPAEEELASLYEERKEAYRIPETRAVEQLLFTSEKDAQAVHGQLQSGTSFEQAAKDDTILNRDNTSLGKVTQADLPPDIEPVVFALETDSYSAPTPSSFGWHIFHVNAIEETRIPSLEEIKARMTEDYRSERMDEEMNRLAGEIEDTLAGGADIKDALESVGLDEIVLKTLSQVDMNGATAGEEKTDGVTPLLRQILDVGFSLDNGETSTLSLTTENEYFLVHVDEVIESQVRAFDDVRDAVKAAWEQEEKARVLKEYATETADRLQQADSFGQAAKTLGLPVRQSGALKRYHDTVTNDSALKDKILTSGFVMAIFALPQDGVTGAYPLPSGEYAVARVKAITPAPAFTEAAESHRQAIDNIREELKNALPNELMDQYLAVLKSTHEVTINHDVLFSGTTPQ